MKRVIIALLVGVAGIATLLTGLGIDAWLHAQDETLAAREGIFTLSNPGHLLLGFGLAIACGGILSALYFAWGMTEAGGILGRRWVRVIGLQASGALSVGAILFALAVSASGHEHAHGDVAAAAMPQLSRGDAPLDAKVLTPSDVAPHLHEAATPVDGGQPSPAVDLPSADNASASMHTHADASTAPAGAIAGDDGMPAGTMEDDGGMPTGDGASDNMHVHADGLIAADGAAMPAAAHAHPMPTVEERACFAELTAEAKAATARFEDINVAIAEGYRVSSNPEDTHMPNPAYMRDGVTFDLANPESLIYVMDDNGERRFVGALYKAFKGQGPTPCGNATYWHTHGRCIAPDGSAIPENKDRTCPPGYEHREGVVEMMHLWFVRRGER